MRRPLKIFITYSHADTKAKDRLIAHLDVLKQNGLIDIWHDNNLRPGDAWRDTIFSNLADSDILLYLVSASSLGSEMCYMELVRSLDRDTRVIPIILEDCDWPNHPLSDFEVLPDKGKPISKWQSESEGWQNVIYGIRRVVDIMQAQADLSSGILPENIRAEKMFQRGHTLMMLGQFNEALETYSNAFKLNPHHNSAYANIFLVQLLIKRERHLRDITKPVVLTEGLLDEQYIQTALTLLGEVKLLNSLEIRSVGLKVNKGTQDGGKAGLDKIRNVYVANSWLFHQPILLLYDCDTNKQEEDSERLWVRLIPENRGNTKVKGGIENLFPEELFQDCFYHEKIKVRNDGGKSIDNELDKPRFCRWICEDRRNPADFEGFKEVVKILKEFVEFRHSPTSE